MTEFYLIRHVQLDGTTMRRQVSSLNPCILIDGDMAGHLARKYPTLRNRETVFEQARGHSLVGGRLQAMNYAHEHGGVRPYSNGLAPTQWPLGDDGWPTMPQPMDMTATLIGSRVLVELQPEGEPRRWCEATVIGTPDAVLLADGSTISASTLTAPLRGALPDQPFELAANGTAHRRTAKGVVSLGRICDAVTCLFDYDFSGDGPGPLLVRCDGKWMRLGDVA